MKELYQARLQVQKQIKTLDKDAVNPFFKSNYLPLESLVEFLLPLFNEAGLVVSQEIDIFNQEYGEPCQVLKLVVLHAETGQRDVSSMLMPMQGTPQNMGSMISYFRRYQLQSAFLIVADADNDAESAMSREPKTKPAVKPSTSDF